MIDFKLIGWGRNDPVPGVDFYLTPDIDSGSTTHGETLLFVFKPIGDLFTSTLVTKLLLGTPHNLKSGHMNVTTLNKEFFRRKLRCNTKDTTGAIISEI